MKLGAQNLGIIKFKDRPIRISEGWMLPKEVFDWINNNITAGFILEFGSGNGSKILSNKYDLISIEHDERWMNMSTEVYSCRNN